MTPSEVGPLALVAFGSRSVCAQLRLDLLGLVLVIGEGGVELGTIDVGISFQDPGFGLALLVEEDHLSAIEEDCAKGYLMQAHTWGLEFLDDGTLLTDGFGGLRIWDSAHGTSQLLRSCDPASFRGEQDAWHGFTLSRDERLGVRILSWTDPEAPSKLTVLDLAGGNDIEIVSHGNRLWWYAALDPTGQTLVTGDKDGLVRAGPITGEEPHLLYGHSGRVNEVAVSPDGRWIASASADGTLRLWPMPAGPPLHTLPYETLLSKLRALTNLRVVADPGSEPGYKLEIGPFPGWAHLPEW